MEYEDNLVRNEASLLCYRLWNQTIEYGLWERLEVGLLQVQSFPLFDFPGKVQFHYQLLSQLQIQFLVSFMGNFQMTSLQLFKADSSLFSALLYLFGFVWDFHRQRR